MAGPKNTVVSDPTPFLPPTASPKPKAPTKSDWAKLGNSRKYKAVDQYWEARKEYWRHFLPDGSGFLELYVKDPEAATRYAVIAGAVIKEIDDVQFRVQRETV
jgi:hypothetical protein